MIKCGRYFTRENLDDIQSMIDKEPGISRLRLSRRICSLLEWRSPNGKLQEMSCRKALTGLDRSGHLKLPPKIKTYSFDKPTKKAVAIDVPELACELRELGEVTVQPVSSRYCKESKIWFAQMNMS